MVAIHCTHANITSHHTPNTTFHTLYTGKLKNGHTITLDDGTVITPDMVLGEGELKKYFIGTYFVCCVLCDAVL